MQSLRSVLQGIEDFTALHTLGLSSLSNGLGESEVFQDLGEYFVQHLALFVQSPGERFFQRLL
jgi:hypothetical protein